MTFLIEIGGSEYSSEDYSYPVERNFRDAWDLSPSPNLVVVNMDKAREIWRDKIRRDREGPLKQLDADYMKALETGSDTASIVAQKQALRDAPALPSIDAATTPEELKAIQPTVTGPSREKEK